MVLKIESVESGVYEAIREDIVHLRLGPGQRLAFDDLARHYGVSHTPVRQALRRLESEGLVTTLPRRGARVASVSFSELEEIQSIRTGVETLLAQRGAAACDTTALEQMEAHLDQIEDALHANDLDLYLDAQWSLRDACYHCAERPRLMRVVREQRHRVERYLRVLCGSVDLLSESRSHQAGLVQACRDRDGAAAEIVTRNALSWTLNRLGGLLESRADLEKAE